MQSETPNNLFSIIREIPDLNPDFIFHIFGFPIASSSLFIFFIILLIIFFSLFVFKSFKIKPKNTQVAIEILYEKSLDLITQITNNDKKHASVIFPIIGSILLYLVISNLIALIPGLTDITFNGVSIFQSPTTDFNTTFGLALGSIIVINIIAIKRYGILDFFENFFKFRQVYKGFKKSISDGFIAVIEFFVGLLDIVGEIAKVVSLALRLFGNMYAGNVLAIILLGAFAYIIPSIWLAMNFFVGILQAMVFAVLVATYYMLTVKNTDYLSEEIKDQSSANSE